MIPESYPSTPGVQAAALQAAFPSYSVSVAIRPGCQPRFELVTRNDGNPWCVISPDAKEIWHELKGRKYGRQ